MINAGKGAGPGTLHGLATRPGETLTGLGAQTPVAENRPLREELHNTHILQ